MFSKWILKAIVQKTISYLPYSQQINYLFQKYITKGVELTDDYFEDRLTHAKNHIHFYVKYVTNSGSLNTYELGTGWYPIVPISMFLFGAENINSIDISPLVSEKNIKTTIAKFIEYYEQKKLQNYIPLLKEKRIKILIDCYEQRDKLTLSEILKILNINLLVGDARKTEIKIKTIDLITSNNTFEHIYPEILTSILLEMKRIAKQGAVMSHFIDMSDHFAHFDKKITIYNFLKYSDKAWKRIDNSVQPQNRLRVNEFCELFKQLNIPIVEEISRKGEPELLNTIKINTKYSESNKSELAVSHTHIINLIR